MKLYLLIHHEQSGSCAASRQGKGTMMIFSTLRSVLIGFAATVATLLFVTPTFADAKPPASETAKELANVYMRANAALVRGDTRTWNALMPLSRDFVLMSPFGGTPSRYADYTPERLERMSRFFRNGRHQQEIVLVFETDDMVVLATIERDHVEVGGLPAQEWALRVTSVFTRDGSRWKLAHRHADPLVADVPLMQSAQLARGERSLAAH
jgi:ketosteroid isomerase-like protein